MASRETLLLELSRFADKLRRDTEGFKGEAPFEYPVYLVRDIARLLERASAAVSDAPRASCICGRSSGRCLIVQPEIGCREIHRDGDL